MIGQCENCDCATNELTEICVDQMGEDFIWVCHFCYEDIQEERREFYRTLLEPADDR